MTTYGDATLPVINDGDDAEALPVVATEVDHGAVATFPVVVPDPDQVLAPGGQRQAHDQEEPRPPASGEGETLVHDGSLPVEVCLAVVSVAAVKRYVKARPEWRARLTVQPCTCLWPEQDTDPKCALRQLARPLVASEAVLALVPDDCHLMPTFQGGRCPLTGCDNGGTRGGWCARAMPPGVTHKGTIPYHCTHNWCHRSPHHSGPFTPCVRTTHKCELVLPNDWAEVVGETE